MDAWSYVDPQGAKQGPYPLAQLQAWAPHFPATMLVFPPGARNGVPMGSVPELGGKAEAPKDEWHYIDPRGTKMGPYPLAQMKGWVPHFPPNMVVFPPGASAGVPLNQCEQLGGGPRASAPSAPPARVPPTTAQREQVTGWLTHVGRFGDLATIFGQIDLNGDGQISVGELQSISRSFPQYGVAPIDALLAMGDADGDGQLSLREFGALGHVLSQVDALKRELGVPAAAGHAAAAAVLPVAAGSFFAAPTDKVVVAPGRALPMAHGTHAVAHTPGTVSRVELGLRWDFLPGTRPVDLDAQCLLYDFAGQLLDACFYNQRSVMGGAVMLSGDNRTGHGEGDDETIKIDLARLPSHVEFVMFFISCYKEGNFNDIKSAQAILRDASNPAAQGDYAPALAHMAVGCQGRHCSGVLALFYRDRTNAWHLQQIGQPLRARSFQDKEAAQAMLQYVGKHVSPEVRRQGMIKPTQGRVFQLRKGDDVHLDPACDCLTIGLGWEANRGGMDLDASVYLMKDKDGDGDQDVVKTIYYGDMQAAFGGRLAVQHMGDNQTGAGAGDDETVHVYLRNIPHDIERIVFAVTCYTQGRDFDDVNSAYIRLVDDRPGDFHDVELARFPITPKVLGRDVTALVFAAIHRNKHGGWMLLAMGKGARGKAGRTPGGLKPVVEKVAGY